MSRFNPEFMGAGREFGNIDEDFDYETREQALQGELGEEILRQWHYPPELVAVPAGHADIARQVDRADLADVVQVASHLAAIDTPGESDWASLPAAARLGLEQDDEEALLESSREVLNQLKGSLA